MFEYNSYQNIMISMYCFVFHWWSVKEKCKMFVGKTWPTQKLKTNNLEKSWRWNNEKGRMEIKSKSFQSNLERTSSQFMPGQSSWPNAIFFLESRSWIEKHLECVFLSNIQTLCQFWIFLPPQIGIGRHWYSKNRMNQLLLSSVWS